MQLIDSVMLVPIKCLSKITAGSSVSRGVRREKRAAQQYNTHSFHLRSDVCSTDRGSLLCAEASISDDFEVPEEQVTGSPAWQKRPAAVTLPAFVRSPERTFLLASFLKVLLLSSVFPVGLVFRPLGFLPQGVVGWLLLIPFAAVLMLLARVIDRSNFLKRRGSGLLVFALSYLALRGSEKLYDWRPPVAPTQPQVAQQSHWRQHLFRSSKPRSAEDSERVWANLDEDLEKEEVERKRKAKH